MLQVIKILKHSTALEPIYIALSSDLRFHAMYGETSIGSHDSVGTAIQSVVNERIYGVSKYMEDWERLMPTAPNAN
jgi:uncharacterized protein YcgI (DUF1989 family)